jgi:hypothetical protein
VSSPFAPVMDAHVRRWLAAMFVLGSLGTAAELLLLEHTEEPVQWVPLLAIAAALLALTWHYAAPSRASVRAFQVVMLLFAAGGALGVALHFRGNAEFERELHPDAAFADLFRGAMMGATPALAPGTMVLLGSIGLLFAYRHPAASRPQLPGRASTEEPRA